MTHPLSHWHHYTENPSPEGLQALLHDDVTFHSPVVHTPQQGKQITFAYLWAANETLGNESFEYLREKRYCWGSEFKLRNPPPCCD